MKDSLFELCKRIANPRCVLVYEDQDLGDFGSISHPWPGSTEYSVHINLVQPPNERLLTLMHEVLHIHPRFKDYTPENITKEIENQITDFARGILNSRPDISIYLQETITKAIELDKTYPF